MDDAQALRDTSRRHEPDDDDRDLSNIMVRAAYVRALARRLPEADDREMLFRAARSLLAYAEDRRGQRR